MATVSEYSTAYGLEPGPKGVVVCLVFERSSRDNTRHRINTVQRDNTHHRYNTSTFFLIFLFLCTKYMENKVGLIKTWAHVFLTNIYISHNTFIYPSFDQLQWHIYACYDGNLTRTRHKFQLSQNVQFALYANKPWTETMDILKVQV